MRTLSALLTVCTAVALSACGSSYNSSSGSTSGGSSSTASSSSGGSSGYGKAPTSSSTSASATGGSNEIDMVDYAFKPKVITGKPGQTVKITLKNTGQAEHNFKIDGQSANADVQPGKTASVKVKIPMSGSIQFYCEYHKARGMVGVVKASG